MDISIQKRDGKKESYSFDKLVTSIAKAGVPIAASNQIAQQVEVWIKSHDGNGVIASTSIRDKIAELLSSEYPIESENYKTYKK